MCCNEFVSSIFNILSIGSPSFFLFLSLSIPAIFLTIYVLKKPSCLSYRVSNILDFGDRITSALRTYKHTWGAFKTLGAQASLQTNLIVIPGDGIQGPTCRKLPR